MEQEVRRINALVAETRRRAARWTPAADEAARVIASRRALQGITSASPALAAFEGVRRLLPFAAGMIEVLSTSKLTEPAHLVHGVPDGFLAARAELIHEDPALPLAVLCPDSLALRGDDAMPDGAFKNVPYCQTMYSKFGLDHVTGMILSPKADSSARAVVVLWLFAGGGERMPTFSECRLLEVISGDLWEAMERARLPFIPHQQGLFQMLQEQGMGYVVLRPNGEVREVNRRAVLLSRKYGDRRRASWREDVKAMVSAARAGLKRGHYVRQRIESPDDLGVLDLRLHKFAREHYGLDEDVFLIQMEETEVDSRLSWLPPRQRKVASLLARTGLSYKEIAQRVGRAEGTIRKQAEIVYRAVGVHSRHELAKLARSVEVEIPFVPRLRR